MFRFVALVFFLLLAIGCQAQAPVPQPDWTPIERASAEARQGGKKILVDVYADWCGWCKKMDREVYSHAAVRAYLDQHFEVVKLNAESQAVVNFQGHQYTKTDLANAFRVTGYPAVAFLDEQSRYITLLPGFMPADKFLVVLRYIAEGHYTRTPFEQYFGAHTR